MMISFGDFCWIIRLRRLVNDILLMRRVVVGYGKDKIIQFFYLIYYFAIVTYIINLIFVTIILTVRADHVKEKVRIIWK
jgi:hypothetical protein